MEPVTEVLALVLVIAAAAGTATVFRGARGKDTVSLLQTNIEAYKDADKLKDQRIAYLEGQLVIKDETIKRLLDGPK